MHSKQKEQQHPGVEFIPQSISIKIIESKVENDNVYLRVDTKETADELRKFLDKNKVNYESENTEFVIDLSSVAGTSKNERSVENIKLDKLMSALRSEGATPVQFSLKPLLKGQVRVKTTNGSQKRLDFFDEHQASVLVPNLREMGFAIEKGECKDVRCYMVDLDKSSIGEKINPILHHDVVDSNSISTKAKFFAWLKTINVSRKETTSVGTQPKKGFDYRLLSVYFKKPETREIVFNKLKADFPLLGIFTPGVKGMLIAHKGNALETETKETPAEKPKTQNITPSESSLKKTLVPNEINEILKKLDLVPSSKNYMKKGKIENVNFDTRGIFFKNHIDQKTLYKFLQKEFPKVKIIKRGKGVLIKATEKVFSRNLKPIEKLTEKPVIAVTEKVVSKTQSIPVFKEEMIELLQRYDMLPKVEQPAGVLIPDSVGDEIVLPHGALLGTGADGITISLAELRKVLKNK